VTAPIASQIDTQGFAVVLGAIGPVEMDAIQAGISSLTDRIAPHGCGGAKACLAFHAALAMDVRYHCCPALVMLARHN
jgi:hypothetical protein